MVVVDYLAVVAVVAAVFGWAVAADLVVALDLARSVVTVPLQPKHLRFEELPFEA